MLNLETIDYKGHTINIDYDDNPQSPREWDNLGTMICFHKRHDLLGDTHNLNIDDFYDWNDLKSYIVSEFDPAVILPLYLYDHSGVVMNTTGFSDRYDSGQVGFIYVSQGKVREEYHLTKKIDKELLEKVKKILIDEVELYNQYLEGEIYGYYITEMNEEDLVDSCYGLYDMEYMIEEAKECIDFKVNRNEMAARIESNNLRFICI